MHPWTLGAANVFITDSAVGMGVAELTGKTCSSGVCGRALGKGKGTEVMSPRILCRCWLRGQAGVSQAEGRDKVKSVSGRRTAGSQYRGQREAAPCAWREY